MTKKLKLDARAAVVAADETYGMNWTDLSRLAILYAFIDQQQLGPALAKFALARAADSAGGVAATDDAAEPGWFDVDVVRSGYGFHTFRVKADSMADAEKKADTMAGDHLFTEKTSEYSIDGVRRLDEETFCRTCGVDYDDGGDGFDGECPSCADKTEALRLRNGRD